LDLGTVRALAAQINGLGGGIYLTSTVVMDSIGSLQQLFKKMKWINNWQYIS